MRLTAPQGRRAERAAFMALMHGRSPIDGTVLRPMGDVVCGLSAVGWSRLLRVCGGR
jgi:hypothetical protein